MLGKGYPDFLKKYKAKYGNEPGYHAGGGYTAKGNVEAGFDGHRPIDVQWVRGEHGTLREAITQAGWPALDACRGKVLFILHDNGAKRDLYTDGHPALRGRAMFVRS